MVDAANIGRGVEKYCRVVGVSVVVVVIIIGRLGKTRKSSITLFVYKVLFRK